MALQTVLRPHLSDPPKTVTTGIPEGSAAICPAYQQLPERAASYPAVAPCAVGRTAKPSAGQGEHQLQNPSPGISRAPWAFSTASYRSTRIKEKAQPCSKAGCKLQLHSHKHAR